MPDPKIEPTAGNPPGPAGAMRCPLVSIIVVNFNGAKWLPACLESLAQATYPNREVILVDNGSHDGSLRVLEGYPWVKVVRSGENLGFAGGNNLGLRHCSGEYVLLLNNDTVVSPGFLEPLCDYLNRRPSVAIVQGKMVLPGYGGTLDVCGSFLTAFGLPYHYGLYKKDGPKYQHSYPVFSAKGACLLFRREVIAKVGGFLFDDAFFCYYEETDFCHRAWLSGCEVHFVSGPAIQHFMGSTAGGPQGLFVLRHYLRNMTFSLMSNLSFCWRCRIMPPFFGVLTASLAASLLKGNLGQAAAHWEALTYGALNYSRVRARRRLVRTLRKKSDREIFRKVLRTPGLGYFFKTFTGNLAQYEDDSLPGAA